MRHLYPACLIASLLIHQYLGHRVGIPDPSHFEDWIWGSKSGPLGLAYILVCFHLFITRYLDATVEGFRSFNTRIIQAIKKRISEA